MASSYTGLGSELMTTGENAGTWGSKTNTNLQILEQIAGGYVEQAVTTTTTLSVSDGSTGATLSHRVIKFTGTLSANATVTIPLDVQQMYVLLNGTAGAYTLTFKYVSGSGSTVAWAATDKGTKIVYATADHASNPNMVDSGISSTGAHDLDGNEFILDADADTSITADTDDQIDIKIAGADDFQFTANTFTAQSGSTIAAQALTATTVTASGIVKTDDTTAATSTTDGSLQTDGGLSVAADAIIGDDLKLLSDSAVLSFGADSDTTLTHTDGTGLTLNSTNKLLFRDTALSISSSTDGQLDIDADTEVEIATTTLDLNGALDVSGASQFSSTITVGVNDTGYDVKFFGATSGAYMLWDESTDDLVLAGASKLYLYDAAGGEYLSSSGSALTIASGGTAWELPAADGSADQYLKTDGSGNLDWATLSSGVSLSAANSWTAKQSFDLAAANITPATDGSHVHIEGGVTMTDTNTSGSGTASKYSQVSIEAITLAASNSSVTTTTASTLYISGSPTAGTNQTLTNAYALHVDAGTVQFDGDLKVGGDLTITGDDLTMSTNTSGAALIGDGTNFNPVTISGDIAIAANGTASIGSGVIVNADVNSSAAIADSKLATISTAGKVDIGALEIDGATDIGAALADADLFIVDDNAGGTEKKCAASRIITYVNANASFASEGTATALAIALG